MYRKKCQINIFLLFTLVFSTLSFLLVPTPYISTKVLAANADFNVQRGCETPSAGTGTVTLTAGTDYTAPTNNDRAFIKLTSNRITGTGDTVGGGNQNPDDWSWYISDPEFAGGSVAFNRAGTANPQRFCWEIIEYIGSNGGNNEMIVRGVGTLTHTTSSTTVDTSTISGVSDDNDIVVFVTGQSALDINDRDEINAAYHTSEWISASDIARFTRGFTGSDANKLSYAVVEFTGTNWSVERVEHTFTADATEETETISSVGSTSRAFFHAQFRLDLEEGLDDSWAEMWLSSTTAVSFRTQNASGALPSQEHAVVWVVSNSDTNSSTAMNVQHGSGTRTSAGVSEGVNNEEDEWSNTITAVSDTSQTSVMGMSGRSTGTGVAYPRGAITFYLNSTTVVKSYQSDDGQTQTYRFQVVEWPQSETPVSISISTDGSVSFGNIASNTTEDTTATGINDTEVVSVDSGPADLNIKSTTFSDGSNTWSLSSSSGSDQVHWEFSPNGSTWNDFLVADNYYSLATGIAQGNTQNVDLRITTPTSTSSYLQHSVTVTVQAVSP